MSWLSEPFDYLFESTAFPVNLKQLTNPTFCDLENLELFFCHLS